MNYLISNINNFHQEVTCKSMKDQIGLFIQYYNVANCEKSPYLSLPKELRNPMKRLINIRTKNQYFGWLLVRYLNLVKSKSSKT